jgi:membrane protein implicated in regulation of membrane protease activity
MQQGAQPMDTPHRVRPPQFTQPVRQIFIMLVILGLVIAGGYLAYPSVAPVFLANPYLNGVIFAVFVFGVLACFWQVLQLRRMPRNQSNSGPACTSEV